jgi:hypothetical protein
LATKKASLKASKGKKLDELRAMPKEFDFYLTYEMAEIDYSAELKPYFPRGL